eukprot:m.70678 g.70678  ORF g.70678 m.70678 type:complete len:286 (-) comp50144_c0_seq16:902-1759(-)
MAGIHSEKLFCTGGLRPLLGPLVLLLGHFKRGLVLLPLLEETRGLVSVDSAVDVFAQPGQQALHLRHVCASSQSSAQLFFQLDALMGKAKKTRAASVKRMIAPHDPRLKSVQEEKAKEAGKQKVKTVNEEEVRHLEQASSALYFRYNSQLGPPYHVLLDTNFINFSIQNRLEIMKAMMDCLYAKCTPYITDCVMAELEKLGRKYRVALRIAKDPRMVRLPCLHKGTYADDCLVERVEQHKCYIVATCDRDLKRRIRKIPGVPIMYIAQRKFTIERMPDAFGAPPV